ncbi:unnamed protein product [Schistosoma curassoni]|uniref:DUF6451 domain-containing protein n=1 Tax=Schistosoma curassoni TaxID=6186 RepID=A0A183JPG4_9TREM|nr:unnamed protein product [Schistosoma curassoni]
MQEKTNSVAAASTAVGLNIHKGKSRILRYNTECTNPITIDGEDLEDVKTFTYLGSITDEQGGSDVDVKARIGKARAAYLQLKNIWNSKQLSINTKIRIFNTNVKTVLLPKEERKIKENITPGNGDRREKNEQELDGIRKEGGGQSGLENAGWWPMLHWE